MTDREKFEAWFRAEWPNLWVGNDESQRFAARVAETAWQASRKQMAEEAAAVCTKVSEKHLAETDQHHALCALGAEQCAAAIRSLATPTEGKT